MFMLTYYGNLGDSLFYQVCVIYLEHLMCGNVLLWGSFTLFIIINTPAYGVGTPQRWNQQSQTALAFVLIIDKRILYMLINPLRTPLGSKANWGHEPFNYWPHFHLSEDRGEKSSVQFRDMTGQDVEFSRYCHIFIDQYLWKYDIIYLHC